MPIRGKTGRRIPKGAKRTKTMKVTTRVKVREPKPQTKATMMNIVNRILNRKTETRFLAQPITATSASPAIPVWENDIPSLGEWSLALPAQTQGDGREQRIGDSISPTDLRVKLGLRIASFNSANPGDPPAYGAQHLPLDVTAYIFYGYIKSLKTYQGSTTLSGLSKVVSGSTEASTAMNRLLDKGDGTFITFDGSPANAMYPLSDYVHMKVKKVRLHKPAGWVNTAANVVPGQGPEQSSDGVHAKEVVLKFKPPSKLKYTNSTDEYPNNYAPVFSVGYVFNDATSNPGAVAYTYGSIEYSAVAMLRYKDFE